MNAKNIYFCFGEILNVLTPETKLLLGCFGFLYFFWWCCGILFLHEVSFSLFKNTLFPASVIQIYGDNQSHQYRNIKYVQIKKQRGSQQDFWKSGLPKREEIQIFECLIDFVVYEFIFINLYPESYVITQISTLNIQSCQCQNDDLSASIWCLFIVSKVSSIALH